ncbi:MAG: hypothetical protein ACT4PT_14365 [Methanobacteriota archaeon]
MDGDDDGIEFEPPARRAREEEPCIEEGFVVDGKAVVVELHAEWAVFRYENGTTREGTLETLSFCPECVRAREFPFVEDGWGRCFRHDSALLPYDLVEYERFGLLSVLSRSS